jgi:hypothetical protein
MSDPTMADFDARLTEKVGEAAVLRAKLEAARSARMTAEESTAEADELATLKRDIAEEEALAAALGKYGKQGLKFERVDTIAGMVLVVPADGVKVRKWLDQHGEDIKQDDLRQLARPQVIYPALDVFDAVVAERPVIVTSVATAVLKLAGLRLKEQGKK